MYNPYNWKINKKPKKICILEQLTEVSNKLDMEKIELERNRKNVDLLIEKKISLLNKLNE